MKINSANISDKMNFNKAGNIAFLLFLIIYSMYLIFLANKLDLSYDEPYSLHTSSKNLSEVINLSYQFEFQPPAYFVILSLWRKINDGILFARLLSVIFTFISAFFLYKVIRLIFNNIYSKWLIIIFLLNPFTVWSATETRLYSFLVLLTILAFYLFYLIYYFDKNNLKIVFILISVIGVYTQYFFVFLIISFAIVLLFSKNWQYFLNYVLLSFIIALLFIPNLVFIKEQFSVNQDTLIEYTISGRIKSMIMASFDFFSIEKITFLGDIGRWIFRIVFISLSTITLVIYFIKNQTQENKEYLNLSFVIIQTLALLLLFTATFIFTNMVYAIRYVTILFPFHILLLVIYGTYKSTLKNIFYGLYSVFLVITLLTSFCNPYLKSYNYKSIAKYTQKIQVKNEPVLFVNNDLSFGLKHLSENEENFINLPEYQFNYNLYNNFVKDTTQLNSLINNIKSKSQSYLVITGTDLGYMRSKNLTNSMIDSFLEYNFIVTSDTIIQGKLSVDFMRIRRILIKNQKL
jgi:uncharacterized membrane protein